MTTPFTWTLTLDHHLAAAEMIARDAMADAEVRAASGPLGAIDRVTDRLQLWFFRGCIAVIALAGCVLLRFTNPPLGIAGLVLLPALAWGYLRLERLVRGGVTNVEQAIDDSVIRRGVDDLAKLVRNRKVPVALGEVRGELDETNNVVRMHSAEGEIVAALGAGALVGRTPTHLLLANGSVRRPADLARLLLVPVDAPFAASIEARCTVPTG